jgi:hypothetical protein
VAIALVLIFGGIAWLCNVTVAYTDAPMLYSLSDMLSRASGPFTVLFAIIMLLVSGGAMLRSRPPRRRNLSKLFSYEIVLLPLFWLLTPSLIVFIWSVNSLSAAVAAGALLFAVAIYRARVLLTATRYANF